MSVKKILASAVLSFSLTAASIVNLPTNVFAGSNSNDIETQKTLVNSVTISGCPAGVMKVGQEVTLTANFDPADADEQYLKVEWDDGGSGVIDSSKTTDTKATIKSTEAGQVTITATAKNGSQNQNNHRKAMQNIQVVNTKLADALVPGNTLTISFVDQWNSSNTVGYQYKDNATFEQVECSTIRVGAYCFMEAARINLVDEKIKVEIDAYRVSNFKIPNQIITITLDPANDNFEIKDSKTYPGNGNFTFKINDEDITGSLKPAP